MPEINWLINAICIQNSITDTAEPIFSVIVLIYKQLFIITSVDKYAQ